MRKMLDKLISWTGLVMAAVLLVAGGLLTWASNFVAENVRTHGPAIEDPLIKPYLTQFAGQPMENGEQARAYADHYILVHMNKSSGGKTYAEVSAEYNKLKAIAGADQAEVAKLGELRQSLFMGSTLRGLLLNAYAFGTMGTIAMYAAYAAFGGAALLFVLGLLGLRHAATVTPTTSAKSLRSSEPDTNTWHIKEGALPLSAGRPFSVSDPVGAPHRSSSPSNRFDVGDSTNFGPESVKSPTLKRLLAKVTLELGGRGGGAGGPRAAYGPPR